MINYELTEQVKSFIVKELYAQTTPENKGYISYLTIFKKVKENLGAISDSFIKEAIFALQNEQIIDVTPSVRLILESNHRRFQEQNIRMEIITLLDQLTGTVEEVNQQIIDTLISTNIANKSDTNSHILENISLIRDEYK